MNPIINILAVLTLAVFAAWHLIEFYRHEWPLHRKDEKKRMLSSNDYNADYVAIMNGIHKSIHVSHLDHYKSMIYRFNNKYINTRHEEDLEEDTEVLLNVCKAREEIITNYMPALN